ERRAEAAAAIENDLRILVWNRFLDVALEHAAPEMDRPFGVALLPLVVLAHVDEDELLPALLALPDVVHRAFLDLLLGVLDEMQEPFAVCHGVPPSDHPSAPRRRTVRRIARARRRRAPANEPDRHGGRASAS